MIYPTVDIHGIMTFDAFIFARLHINTLPEYDGMTISGMYRGKSIIAMVHASYAMKVVIKLIMPVSFNTLGPGQKGRDFADGIFKCIFLNEDV